MANKAVVIGALGITATGIISAAIKQKPVTPVILGGYTVALVGSLVDLIPGAGVIAGGIVLAAMFGIFLVDVPWTAIFAALNGGKGGNEPGSITHQTSPNPTQNVRGPR